MRRWEKKPKNRHDRNNEVQTFKHSLTCNLLSSCILCWSSSSFFCSWKSRQSFCCCNSCSRRSYKKQKKKKYIKIFSLLLENFHDSQNLPWNNFFASSFSLFFLLSYHSWSLRRYGTIIIVQRHKPVKWRHTNKNYTINIAIN